jgi:ABC-type oligopeptide transport system substrate-binding subunit
VFHGDPLEDLVRVPFAGIEVGRLEELRLQALEQRLDADLAAGRHAEVIGELEALAARNPFREGLWGQLMLALYRSGRQAEALSTFDRARRILADQLALEPGESLKRLQRQILEQDASLDPPVPAAPDISRAAPVALESAQVARSRATGIARKAAAGLLAVALAAFLVARLVQGEGGDASASGPGTVLIDVASGKATAAIPLSQLAVSAYPVFSGGHFWVNEFSPGAYVEIDPRTGGLLRRLNPPPWPANVPQSAVSLTPFAVKGNTLWVASGRELAKVDVRLARAVDRVRLPRYEGEGSGVVEGVAVGGGSVWVSRDVGRGQTLVSRDVGRGQILRLDPATGTEQHRFDDMTAYVQLAYGDGSLWAADERGIARIDAATNTVTRGPGIQGNTWIAAGGGFGWTSDSSKGVVYKVDRAGRLVETYPTGLGAGFISYMDGVLWVANHDEGTVTGIDAVTGQQTTFRFDHPVETIVAGAGVLLVHLPRGPTVEEFIASIPGKVPRFFAESGQLGQGDEPALNTTPGAFQVDHATCAMLMNYPDEPGAAGRRLRPEIAAAMPTLSADERTYTFTIRPGYRFSPPSNQPVTAGTFRYTIERALSPRLRDNPSGQRPPGPRFVDDIEGERAFRDARAEHISGLRASGDTLSITLTKPSPDFLARLALPFFCPVPVGTPLVAGAPSEGEPSDPGGNHIVSAGPYYVADYSNEEHVILKRNPNYHGPRPHTVDAIAIRERVAASAALERIQQRGYDGITTLTDPLLAIGGAVDRQWGASSAAAGRGDQRYFATPLPRTRFIAFNANRGVFADRRVRRAAALALDRSALAAAWSGLETDQLLSEALPGHREREIYAPHAALAEARRLMQGRTGRALMPVPPGCDPCARAAQLVRHDLAAIGIAIAIRTRNRAARADAYDLIDAETGIPYPDSASFLKQLLGDTPRGWIPPAVRARINHVARLTGDRRQPTAAVLADRLMTNEVAVAAYATPAIGQFIGPRLGCRVFNPFRYGLDLAALCMKRSSS